MDFKKVAENISSSFSRAVQLTEEKLGQADRTQYGADYERLSADAEATLRCVESTIRCLEAALQPNPALRLEDAVGERLRRPLRARSSPLEQLGAAMVTAAGQLGPGCEFGDALAKVGQTEQRLAQLQRELALASGEVLLQPLRAFLANEARDLNDERRLLEARRLDYDAARARAERARPQPAAELQQECSRLRQCLDAQLNATRLALERVRAAQTTLTRCLEDFADAQLQYYSECHRQMQELRRQLPAMGQSDDPDSPL